MRAFARQMTERMKAVAAAGAVAAFWLAVWVLVAGLVAQPLILPGPGAVAVALLRLVCDASTWAILMGSGVRILGGLALAAVCGGVLAGSLGAVACVCAPGGSGTVVCKGDAGCLRGGPAAHLVGVGTCEHRGGLFDGAAGRIFLAGRGFDAG